MPAHRAISSHSSGGGAAASSAHVNAVADAIIRMFSSENAEEKTSESDAEMEIASERARRHGNSELCEVSDRKSGCCTTMDLLTVTTQKLCEVGSNTQ